MGYVIQQKAIATSIWFEPDGELLFAPRTRAENVSVLRVSIEAFADATGLPFRQHFRIVTHHGDPVERWLVVPGRAVRIRRRY